MSSFWSARERLINRKKRVENYIDRIENNETDSLLKEKNLLDDLNDDTEIETLENLTFKNKNNINQNNLLNICKQEREQLNSLIEYSDYLKEKHSEPDPKIEHLKIILNKIKKVSQSKDYKKGINPHLLEEVINMLRFFLNQFEIELKHLYLQK